MPLWLIYHPPSVFTSPQTKQTLAAAITEIYTAADLPAFYVNVLFQPVEPSSFYIGGVARPTAGNGKIHEKPFVRITIEHLARQMYVLFCHHKYTHIHTHMEHSTNSTGIMT